MQDVDYPRPACGRILAQFMPQRPTTHGLAAVSEGPFRSKVAQEASSKLSASGCLHMLCRHLCKVTLHSQARQVRENCTCEAAIAPSSH